MDLETYLRVHLDTKNHANRPLAEHRVTVSEPAPGVLVISVHPEGFNTEGQIFQVAGNTVIEATPVTLAKLREDAHATELAAEHARDVKLEAEAKAERHKAEAIERARLKVQAAEEARLAPLDIAKALPDGDPMPEAP